MPKNYKKMNDGDDVFGGGEPSGAENNREGVDHTNDME